MNFCGKQKENEHYSHRMFYNYTTENTHTYTYGIYLIYTPEKRKNNNTHTHVSRNIFVDISCDVVWRQFSTKKCCFQSSRNNHMFNVKDIQISETTPFCRSVNIHNTYICHPSSSSSLSSSSSSSFACDSRRHRMSLCTTTAKKKSKMVALKMKIIKN